MTTALIALCALTSVAQNDLHWPFVPKPMFSVNGLDSGADGLAHGLIVLKPDNGPNTSLRGKESPQPNTLFLALPPGTDNWRTLQLAFKSTSDGTLARFGGVGLMVKNGHLLFTKGAHSVDIAPLLNGEVNDVQILKHQDSLLAYVNGTRAEHTMMPTAPLFPIQLGLDSWKGSIIAISGYGRELSVDEMFANERSAVALTKPKSPVADPVVDSGPDTPTVTIEGELGAFTPVPDLDRIKPYRSALLADEYKVLKVTKGHRAGLKAGMKIRVFRWGIRAGEKTDLQKAKAGDHAEMILQPYDSDPKFEREFQVDTLDPDISALVFVDVTPQN